MRFRGVECTFKTHLLMYQDNVRDGAGFNIDVLCFLFECMHSGETTCNTCMNTMLLKLVISLFNILYFLPCALL